MNSQLYERVIKREANRVRFARLRARKANLPTRLNLDTWMRLRTLAGNLCVYCRERPVEMLDHFLPIVLGGSTVSVNVVPCCLKCGHSKGSKHPRDWLASLPRDRANDVLAFLRKADSTFRSTAWERCLTWRGYPKQETDDALEAL